MLQITPHYKQGASIKRIIVSTNAATPVPGINILIIIIIIIIITNEILMRSVRK